MNCFDRPIENFRQKFRIRNDLLRCAISEFISSIIFVWAGTSVSGQALLSRGRANEYLSVVLGWALSLLIATQLAFRISGGHLNPAVSFFFYTFRQISFTRFIIYSFAQIIGSFVGSFLTFFIYYDAINAFDGGKRYVTGPFQTAKIFATYPAEHLSTLGGLIDQILGTLFLCICFGMITDHRNRIPSHLQPTFIGLSLALIGSAFGYNSGYALNPARDFGPRLFTLFAGYGFKVFSYRSYKWFWIPIIGPLIGGVIGAWLYHLAIGIHIPSEIDDLEEKVYQIQLDKSVLPDQHNQLGKQQNDDNNLLLKNCNRNNLNNNNIKKN